MGYNKIISYGNTLEIYEYEKDIVRVVGRTRRNASASAGDGTMGAGGEDSLPEGDSKVATGKRSDNARRASVAFRRIVASNLGGSSLPLLITLTYRDNVTDLSLAYSDLTAFNQALRRRFGKAFSYAVVPEFQKRGAVHFHALYWGLPADIFPLERENRTISKIWGKGFVFIKETDGRENLSFYLAKYFTKAYLDPRLKNQKSYVVSRNMKRPLIQKGPFIIPVVLEEYGVTSEPVVDRKYLTSWLGEARYRVYKLEDD